ncbi:MAG TPA: ComEC/Rec2 family competence protein [Pirellulales bacterium]|nr:ComEC/Rec2 family competence protein [Pirellulales bacterium]
MANLCAQPLPAVLVTIIVGIGIDRWRPVAAPYGWLLSCGLLAIWATLFALNWRFGRVACLCCASIAAGAAWHHARWNLFADDEIGLCATDQPQSVCVEAIALESPRRVLAGMNDPLSAVPHGDRTRLLVDTTTIRDGGHWREISGRALMTIDGHLLGVHAGDRLRAVAQLASPSSPQNPGEFDFACHRRADRQLCRLWVDGPAAVTVVEHAERWSASAIIDWLRQRGQQMFDELLPQRAAPLAAALILGSREQLDAEQADGFFRTGMVHLLSISGLHVGLLALGSLCFLRLGLLRRTTTLVGCAALTIAYALLVHAEPPAVRATILVVLTCTALIAGRSINGYNALAAAGIVVLAINPADLFRAGPQLSFLCALALVWFAQLPQPIETDRLFDELAPSVFDQIRVWLRRVGRGIALSLLLSLCIWCISLPLVAYQFHIVSPIALLLTPLLAPLIGCALFSGFGLLLVGWLLPPVGAVLALLCGASLVATQVAIEFASRMPLAYRWVVGPSGAWVLGFYAIVLASLVVPMRRGRTTTFAIAVSAWCAIGLLATSAQPRDDALRTTFLSVGHGLAVVLELPDGRTWLYDAGCLTAPERCANTIACFLWSRGIGRIDTVMISHADVDHFNALPELTTRVPIGRVLVSEPMLQSARDRAQQIMYAALEDAGIPIATVKADTDVGPVDAAYRLHVLQPPDAPLPGSDNSHSIVLSVEYRGRRILLTGDLESPGLERLLASPPSDYDAILAPHHGSANRSNHPGLADWSKPEWVVLSGAAGKDSSAAESAYLKRGAVTLHTGRTGAVTVIVGSSGQIEVYSFLDQADDHKMLPSAERERSPSASFEPR